MDNTDTTKPHQETVSDDLHTVRVAESEYGEELFHLILQRRATPSEVEGWYLSRDPLGETMDKAGGYAVDSRHPDLLIKKVLLEVGAYEQGAALMAASVAFPGLFEDETTSRKWLTVLDKQFEEQSQELGETVTQPQNKLSSDEVIRFALHTLGDKELTPVEMHQLSIAAEMMEASVTLSAGAIRQVKRLFGEAGPALLQAVYDTAFKGGVNMQVGTAINMYHWELIKKRLTSEVFGKEKVLVDEKLKYALKQEWRWDTQKMQFADRPEDRKRGLDVIMVLQDMVRYLRMGFLETDILTNPDMKAQAKGLLHELEWALDGYMLIFSDKKYEGIGITAAMEFEDAPKIGRPNLRRNYDYMIGLKGHDSQLIQLKSGSQVRAPYNGRIRVVYEDNFQDFNARRLAAKLGQYEMALENGLTTSDSRAVLDRYVLKSVRLEIDELAGVKERDDHLKQAQADYALRRTVQHDGQTHFTSSAERRKYEKTLRKQSKSRNGREA